MRPEQGLIRLRGELDVYANLRPARGDGIDLLIVRELVGGLYFGASGRRADGSAFDTCEYSPAQIERIARRGFELARTRRSFVTSVDKANVLETSRLWREVVSGLAGDYPDVRLEHMLVDNAGMQLVLDPAQFDVILTENTFGDILSDVAAGSCGGLGVAASASLGELAPRHLRARARLGARHRGARALRTRPARSARSRCCCATPPERTSWRTSSSGRSTQPSVPLRRATSAGPRRRRSSPTPF